LNLWFLNLLRSYQLPDLSIKDSRIFPLVTFMPLRKFLYKIWPIVYNNCNLLLTQGRYLRENRDQVWGFLGTLWICRQVWKSRSMKSRHEGAIRILPEELLGFKNLLSFASHKWRVNRWLVNRFPLNPRGKGLNDEGTLWNRFWSSKRQTTSKNHSR
jgi:hypothetical protein